MADRLVDMIDKELVPPLKMLDQLKAIPAEFPFLYKILMSVSFSNAIPVLLFFSSDTTDPDTLCSNFQHITCSRYTV